MKFVLSILAVAALAVVVGLPANISASSIVMPKGSLSDCVSVLDFPDPPDCVGEWSLMFEMGGKMYEPLPLPASSHMFVRDEVTATWQFYQDGEKLTVTNGGFVSIK